MVSMDETDGFDDFESDLSSSDELVTISGSHSQSQKKGVKSGEFFCQRKLTSSSVTTSKEVVGIQTK